MTERQKSPPAPQRKCHWFGCDEPAEVLVKRTGSVFCEEHYLLNCLRFGDLKGELLNEENKANEG